MDDSNPSEVGNCPATTPPTGLESRLTTNRKFSLTLAADAGNFRLLDFMGQVRGNESSPASATSPAKGKAETRPEADEDPQPGARSRSRPG
jgi:hypothetical protein